MTTLLDTFPKFSGNGSDTTEGVVTGNDYWNTLLDTFPTLAGNC